MAMFVTRGRFRLAAWQPESMRRPARACSKVYDGDFGYTDSAADLARITLGTDSVFGDDKAAHERPTMTGTAKAGYTASMVIGI